MPLAKAVNLAPQILVNAILPGTIHSYPEIITPEAEKQIGSRHLVGRIGECAEMTNGCVFLASDEASFITGHRLVIDGVFRLGNRISFSSHILRRQPCKPQH